MNSQNDEICFQVVCDIKFYSLVVENRLWNYNTAQVFSDFFSFLFAIQMFCHQFEQ